MTVINLAFQGTASDGLTKLRLPWPWEHFWGKKLLIKLYFLFHFWTMSLSFPAFCLKIFIGSAKVLAFHLSKGTILGKSFQKLCASSIIFGSWTNFFGLLLMLFQVLSKFKFYVSRRTCRVKVWCFAEIRNSYQFWKLRKNFAAFSQDVFVGVVEIAFHLSIWTFWGQKIRKRFYDFMFIPRQWAEKSGFLSNGLSRDRQYRNLPIQGEENFSSIKRNVKPFSDIQRKTFGLLS